MPVPVQEGVNLAGGEGHALRLRRARGHRDGAGADARTARGRGSPRAARAARRAARAARRAARAAVRAAGEGGDGQERERETWPARDRGEADTRKRRRRDHGVHDETSRLDAEARRARVLHDRAPWSPGKPGIAWRVKQGACRDSPPRETGLRPLPRTTCGGHGPRLRVDAHARASRGTQTRTGFPATRALTAGDGRLRSRATAMACVLV